MTSCFMVWSDRQHQTSSSASALAPEFWHPRQIGQCISRSEPFGRMDANWLYPMRDKHTLAGVSIDTYYLLPYTWDPIPKQAYQNNMQARTNANRVYCPSITRQQQSLQSRHIAQEWPWLVKCNSCFPNSLMAAWSHPDLEASVRPPSNCLKSI